MDKWICFSAFQIGQIFGKISDRSRIHKKETTRETLTGERNRIMQIWQEVVAKYRSAKTYFDEGEVFRATCQKPSARPVFARTKETYQTNLLSNNRLIFKTNSYFGPFLNENIFEARANQFFSTSGGKLLAHNSFDELLLNAISGSINAGLFVPALIGLGGRFSENECSILTPWLDRSHSRPEVSSVDNYYVIKLFDKATEIDIFINSETLAIHRIIQKTQTDSLFEYLQFCYVKPVFDGPEQAHYQHLKGEFDQSATELYQLNSSQPSSKIVSSTDSQIQPRVIVVEGQHLLRAGLEAALSKHYLTTSSNSLTILSNESQTSKVELLVANVNTLTSIQSDLATIRTRFPNLKIMIIGGLFSLTSHFLQLQRLGVNAISLIDSSYVELLNVIEKLVEGGSYVDPRLKEIMDQRLAGEDTLKLTDLELAILRRIDMADKGLCLELNIDSRKLDHVRTLLLKKLNASSKTRAGLIAASMGYILLPILPELDPSSGFTPEHRQALLAAQAELALTSLDGKVDQREC